MQLHVIPTTNQPAIVTGADGVKTQCDTTAQNRRELDLLVAAQTGIRSTPGGILGEEVAHHIISKAIREIPHIERNAEYIGSPASVVSILLGAAAACPGTIGLGVLVQRQVHSGDVVSGVERPRCGNGGVNATRHCRQYLHSLSFREL